MKSYWLLPSFLSFFLLVAPAEAAKLIFWRFDSNQNRLDFSTDAGVQPKAQMLLNPTRLVIDLPGTTMQRPTDRQRFNSIVCCLRVGQADEQTTRLVIELNPGYTLDPQQVVVRGLSPTQWMVKLPSPIRAAQSPINNDASSTQPVSLQTITQTTTQTRPIIRNQPSTPVETAMSGLQVQNLQVTRDGFFIRTSGGKPSLKVNRSRDRRTINIDIADAALSQVLQGQDLTVNRHGVSSVQFTKSNDSASSVRVTLNLVKNSPDWQANFSNLGGGIVILPQGEVPAQAETPVPIISTQRPNSNSVYPLNTPNTTIPIQSKINQLATIQSIELTNSGGMLLVRADRSVSATSRWDNASGAYQITIPSAQLAERVTGPQLNVNSPVSRIRLRQRDANTVVILVQPANGVQLGELNQIGEQLIGLQLLRTRAATPATISTPSSTPIPVTSIPVPVPPPENNLPVAQVPRVPSGKTIVMIDPGHGGKDSGAVSPYGYYEKDVILTISRQVATLLEQQGVQVIMTRDSDYFVDLAPRVVMAQRTGADLFVSIHANSISNRPDVQGLETYHYGAGEGLARTVHNSILQGVNIRDRGVRRARFYVLRKNSIPSILVETGYVTSPQEAPKLNNPEYQRQMAAAIARGILQYIKQKL